MHVEHRGGSPIESSADGSIKQVFPNPEQHTPCDPKLVHLLQQAFKPNSVKCLLDAEENGEHVFFGLKP